MSYCGNRGPISGECMIGCGGFGSCRQGHEDHIHPRSDSVNWLTGRLRTDTARKQPTSTETNVNESATNGA